MLLPRSFRAEIAAFKAAWWYKLGTETAPHAVSHFLNNPPQPLPGTFQNEMAIRNSKQVVPDARSNLWEHLFRKSEVTALFSYELAAIPGLNISRRSGLVLGPDPIQCY